MTTLHKEKLENNKIKLQFQKSFLVKQNIYSIIHKALKFLLNKFKFQYIFYLIYKVMFFTIYLQYNILTLILFSVNSYI